MSLSARRRGVRSTLGFSVEPVPPALEPVLEPEPPPQPTATRDSTALTTRALRAKNMRRAFQQWTGAATVPFRAHRRRAAGPLRLAADPYDRRPPCAP